MEMAILKTRSRPLKTGIGKVGLNRSLSVPPTVILPVSISVVTRVEWIHAKAAVNRWGEELRLLQTESFRIIMSFEATAGLWRRRSIDTPFYLDGREWELAGYRSYCASQALVFSKLAEAARSQTLPLSNPDKLEYAIGQEPPAPSPSVPVEPQPISSATSPIRSNLRKRSLTAMGTAESSPQKRLRFDDDQNEIRYLSPMEDDVY